MIWLYCKVGVIIPTTFTGPGGLLTNWVIVSKEMRKNYQSFPNSLQVRWPGVNNQKFISESPVQNFGKSRRSRELLITEGPDQFHLIQSEICFNLLFLSQLLSSTVQKIRIFYSKLFLDRFAICDEQRNTWRATDVLALWRVVAWIVSGNVLTNYPFHYGSIFFQYSYCWVIF